MALEASISVSPTGYPDPTVFVATATIYNTDLVDPVTIALEPLSSPSVALEVEMTHIWNGIMHVPLAGGAEPVLMPPPPVPGAEIPAPVVEILPGGLFARDFPGFAPAELVPGLYRAKVHYISETPPGTDIESPFAPFEVTPL